MRRAILALGVAIGCSSDAEATDEPLLLQKDYRHPVTRVGASIRVGGARPAGVDAAEEYALRRSIGFLFDLGRLSPAGLALVDRADTAPRDGFVTIEELLAEGPLEDPAVVALVWRWMRAPRIVDLEFPRPPPPALPRPYRLGGNPYVDASTPKTMHAIAIHADLDGPDHPRIFELPLTSELGLRFTRTVAYEDERHAAAADDAGASFRLSSRFELSFRDRLELVSPGRAVVRLERDGERTVTGPIRSSGDASYELWTDEPVARVFLASSNLDGVQGTSLGELTGFRLRAFDRDLDQVVTDDAHSRLGATFRWTGTRGPRDRPVAPDDLLLGERLDSTAPGHYEASLSDGTPVLADVYPEGAVFATVGRDPEKHLVPIQDRWRGTQGYERTEIFVGEGRIVVRRRDSGTALDAPLDETTRKAW
ncbi:MAG: hypothetical protein U0270_07520 [Labilithrix sp.]